MKISDIKRVNSYFIELTSKKDVKIKANTPVKLFENGNQSFITPIDPSEIADVNEAIQVVPVNLKNEELLEQLLRRNLPRLAVVLNVTKKREMTLEVKVFSAEKPMDISIAVEDDFIDKIKKQMKLKSLSRAEESLTDAFLISIHNFTYGVMGVHTNANKDDLLERFLLLGKEGYLQIHRKKDENDQTYFVVEKLISSIKDNEYAFFLIKGAIRFTKSMFLEKARLETLAAMQEIGSTITGYMNTWEAYGQIEQEETFKKVKKAGVVPYTNKEYLPNGVLRLDIEDSEKLANLANYAEKGEGISICSVDPDDLFGSEITIDRYQAFTLEAKEITVELAEDIEPHKQRIYIKRVPDDAILDNSGYLFLSLAGDISRFRRRKEARDNILAGRSYMPHLAAILERQAISKPVKKRTDPISQTVREKIFPVHPPTPMQKEAIDIALNTPDIAIIQGPPGTGKTTVILAILERLNEIYDSSSGIFGKNLVSAFQHDAVQNAIDRIEIFGLPGIKFGQKRGEAGDDELIIEHTVENWMEEKRQELYQKYPEILKEKYMEEFDKIYVNYLYSANTTENTLKLLKETKELLLSKLSMELLQKIDKVIAELKLSLGGHRDPQREHLVKSIHKIPYVPQVFEDNGIEAIMEAIYRLKKEENSILQEDIDELMRLTIPPLNEQQFQMLRHIRKRILTKLIPAEEIFHTAKQKEDIVSLFTEISDYISADFNKSKSGEDAVLLDYISEFENSPLSIRNSLLDYVSVLGATNQQSVGRVISQLKGETEHYDNVLIDEAARSNPLDLFIPMSLAKDRIILVGDHRQLPHIIDEGIVKEIEGAHKNEDQSVSDKVNENIKKSMFEHLFQTLKILQKKDGILRTVTLDKQYRTHPVLGDFVSSNFYEKHGEVHIGSGLPAETFRHDLQGLEDKACVWYDIPIEKGAEVSGQSKSRPIEAKKIVAHLKKLMDSGESKGLNFGIITFYSSQVKAIHEELVKVGIATKNDANQYEIKSNYRVEVVNGKKIEKLRIGTVDAFQGMEFDVVYLSMVRSNELPDKTEQEKQRKYGFLMVENRLCVSMSRQKKLLIVAGDSAMLRSSGAEHAISPLVNYYDLCKGNKTYGKIIHE
ncbi:hypothetical protein JCM9140_3677 [Halalkalibacter wakoensis JCM 9140]|uniref:AAA+ ATPase domain-containing protein n=1 Tax=Halalkalibacter wakoensis JCM 9140 TaxID=1236970 RepID=W4Q6E3_9BACI|nr:AAA domain-containing protein [Halalkalibacter wakoensis]GAE27525.1 hypothetical protein JCM9140_3677 [Halalkalibacter wakoensis JCM 9140]